MGEWNLGGTASGPGGLTPHDDAGPESAAVAFMKLSKDYFDFIDKLDQHYPRFGEQYRLPFPYEPDQDDGKGL